METIETTWEQITKDFQTAVNEIYYPLTVECHYSYMCISYNPPFFFHDRCDEWLFGVIFDNNVPAYPLSCHSDMHGSYFVVSSPNDWSNHTDKFVTWKEEIIDLFDKVKSSK
jgi:hypothetical protein